MRYITYEQAEQIPAFQGKTPADVAGLVADATLVWRYIQGNPWATDAQLQAAGTQAGLDAERIGAALQLLRDTHRIFGFEDTPLLVAAVPVAPAVTEQLPGPGATGVPVDTKVCARVNQALDETTAALAVATGGKAVPGAVAYDPATLQITFTPKAALAAGTVYTATVPATVSNGSGVPLPNDVSWSFTTA